MAVQRLDLLCDSGCVGLGDALFQFALSIFGFGGINDHLDSSTCFCDTMHLPHWLIV